MTGTGMICHLWGGELNKCIGDFSVVRMKFPGRGGNEWRKKK